MDPRAAWLIRELQLVPHPEGGWFRETFRSPRIVTLGGNVQRSALTSIHYLLVAGEFSRWHRVAQDELWHFVEGAPLELLSAAPGGAVEARILSLPGAGAGPTRVIPAGHWQAARPRGSHVLVSCSMGPGFEFSDFELMRDRPEEAAAFEASHPEWAALI